MTPSPTRTGLAGLAVMGQNLTLKHHRERISYFLCTTKHHFRSTGKWTGQQAAELSIAAPTISSLDSRFLSGLKDKRGSRCSLAEVYKSGVGEILYQSVDKKLIDDCQTSTYASKIRFGKVVASPVPYSGLIKQAYNRYADLATLLVDPGFAKEMTERQAARQKKAHRLPIPP
ncbi:hypothetical protein POM88_024207 [Heracleum sosnowskyi]|uniref:phosphogluconate dehydrogenase (NADP(+)-dependent, decarboxylating) n=1 Tax=Heracleum sosnowskyi TaxID=360622 RepID=A0AAD8MMM7_9APIA|nr:hypothetical protein POM88_024207 [Heracleum sosnowskyi]